MALLAPLPGPLITALHRTPIQVGIFYQLRICTSKNLYVGIDRDSCSFISLDLYKTTTVLQKQMHKYMDGIESNVFSILPPIGWPPFAFPSSLLVPKYHLPGQSSHHTRILVLVHFGSIDVSASP
jgi:hypothetical protein